MASWVQWGFQDGTSFLMEQLIFFHDHAMMILILVMTLVGYGSVALLFSKYTSRSLLEREVAETIWTIAPFVVLLFIALPSLRLLYLMDELHDPVFSIKIVGHQWYWSYEYLGLDNKDNSFSVCNDKFMYDSYMLSIDDLVEGDYNLLEVDNRMVIPANTPIRLLITGADVLHSWTVPSLGVKVDAVPGRLNQASLIVKQRGVFYGQCSEICGANHAYMPIVVESISLPLFADWCVQKLDA